MLTNRPCVHGSLRGVKTVWVEAHGEPLLLEAVVGGLIGYPPITHRRIRYVEELDVAATVPGVESAPTANEDWVAWRARVDESCGMSRPKLTRPS